MMQFRAHSRRRFLILLVTTLLLGLNTAFPAHGAAAGTTYYVAPYGSDSSPGTADQPWRTIQRAASTMVAGDTVYVRAGTYNEQVMPQKSGTSGNPIAYRAYPGETVTIDGQNSLEDGFYFNYKHYLIIDGFIIKNWRLFGLRFADSTYIEISNNEITSPDGVYSGIWADDSLYCNIHHNIIHDCPENGIAMSTNYDRHANGSDYNRIHHNFVYNTSIKWPEEWEGIGFEVGSNYNHIYNNLIYANRHAGLLTNTQYNFWYHNTIYSNPRATAGRWGEIAGFGGGIYMCNWEGDTPEHNVFMNNLIITTGEEEYTVYVQEVDGKNNTFDNNIHWHIKGQQATKIAWGKVEYPSVWTFYEWQSRFGQEPRGLNIDPKIEGLVQGGDPTSSSFYQLMADSPAIDRGVMNVNWAVTDDFSDNPRSDGMPDVGAFEYVGTVPQPTDTAVPQPTPTNTAVPQPTPTNTALPQPTQTNTAVPQPTPTNTALPQPTQTNTAVPQPTPTTAIPTATPATLPGLSWEAESGVISYPFAVTDGAVSQSVWVDDPAKGGKASYRFAITEPGDYTVDVEVDAPDVSRNSFYVNVDGEPSTPMMIWDVPITNGFEKRAASWRGRGTEDSNEFVPRVFALTAGEHELVVRGREGETHFDRISLERFVPPPPTSTPTDTATPTPTDTATPTPTHTPTTVPAPRSNAVMLYGKVYDALAGYDTAIAGARVSLAKCLPGNPRTDTDADGNYSLIVSGPELDACFQIMLQVKASGYSSLSVVIPSPGLRAEPRRDIALMPKAKWEPQALGDVNGDQVVNLFDLVVVSSAYDPEGLAPSSAADVNGDGVVDLFDLVGVSSNYGATYP